MSNLRGRLDRLEAHVGPPPGDPTKADRRERLLNDFFHRALDAVAHVRRSTVEGPRWRYDVEKLEGESPITVAAYVGALTHLQHPDESAARERLAAAGEREFDTATLGGCVDAFVRFGETRGRGKL